MGLLLARAGVEVTVLEKHGDFLRDFRGDTVHPTTLDLLDELGLGEGFAKLPQRRLTTVQLPIGGRMQTLATFTGLPGRHKYIAMVPQWDLLDLLTRAADREPTFRLRMNTEGSEVIWADGRVAGVGYRTKDGGSGEIRADLTVACDGRTSVLRSAAGLGSRRWAMPFDVWWYTDGLLCLGDAAHAMSPVGGVGINLAVQDAVAAARILAPLLLSYRVTTSDLARVQRRRLVPTAITQAVQRVAHARAIAPAVSGAVNLSTPIEPPCRCAYFAESR